MHYTYTTPNGATKPSGVSAAAAPMPISTFECRPVKASQFASDGWTKGVIGSLASIGVSDICVQTRYTGITKSNAAVMCQVGDTTSMVPVVLASLELPSQLTLDTGTYTPTLDGSELSREQEKAPSYLGAFSCVRRTVRATSARLDR